MAIRVLVADGSLVYRSGLRAELAAAQSVQIVGEAGTREQVPALAKDSGRTSFSSTPTCSGHR